MSSPNLPESRPRLIGRWAMLMLQTPPAPTDDAGLLAEPISHRARREATEWANNRAVPFGIVSIFTGALAAVIVGVAIGGLLAVIVAAVLGLLLGVYVLLLFEGVYMTPRRILALALAENARLVTAAEGKLPPQELHAIDVLVDRASELAETWRGSIPNHPAMQQSNSDFRSWCDDVLSFFARVQEKTLTYTEFKNLTPMKHERGEFLENAADDICLRRDWLLDFVKNADKNG